MRTLIDWTACPNVASQETARAAVTTLERMFSHAQEVAVNPVAQHFIAYESDGFTTGRYDSAGRLHSLRVM